MLKWLRDEKGVPWTVLGVVGGHIHVGDFLLDHAEVGCSEATTSKELLHHHFYALY